MKNGKACYVENNAYAAAWLRNLVSRGVIAPGDVMCRSVTDITPAELSGYNQVHLYAGIGVWSYSLRRAGIADTANVWTFSEPCQPFSDAGKGLGFADERYLRPYTNHLVEQCRPAICLGEQVASNDGLGWLDIVQTDFERARYACGAQDTCSAGYGAPHIRQRLRVCAATEEWLADTNEHVSRQRRSDTRRIITGSDAQPRAGLGQHGGLDVLVHPERAGLEGLRRHGDNGNQPGRLGPVPYRSIAAASGVVGVASTDCERSQTIQRSGVAEFHSNGAVRGARPGFERGGSIGIGHNSLRRPGSTNGFWSNADWLFCRDGKWRPVEPGTFPLAHGATSRVGRLRAYGNAVDAEATTEFCREVGRVLGLI